MQKKRRDSRTSTKISDAIQSIEHIDWNDANNKLDR
jgi:hypothetical protein